jgi:hypothetical protein
MINLEVWLIYKWTKFKIYEYNRSLITNNFRVILINLNQLILNIKFKFEYNGRKYSTKKAFIKKTWNWQEERVRKTTITPSTTTTITIATNLNGRGVKIGWSYTTRALSCYWRSSNQ